MEQISLYKNLLGVLGKWISWSFHFLQIIQYLVEEDLRGTKTNARTAELRQMERSLQKLSGPVEVMGYIPPGIAEGAS